MAGKRRVDVGRRRFIRLAGGTAAGAAVVGGGAFTAVATGVFSDPTPDPFARIPRSLALSLPEVPGDGQPPLPPLPDQLEGGNVSAPSRQVPYARSTPVPREVSADVPTTLPFTFNKSGFTLATDLPEYLRPWRDRPTRWENVSPSTGTYRLNADGVYLYYPGGGTVGYDHPVGQIQFGLGCITSYRIEGDATRKALFLKRAKDQANRLIEKRVEARGAWYFPYPFDYKHAVHSGVDYKAPWYSGMAQGEAISLFIQLAELDGLTEDERVLYRAAADGAFASLLRADDGTPWVVNKDRSGYFWIQEYPFAQPGTGDYTYNGMIFAMFGLWDYYVATGNELAAQLYDGSCTTISRYFPLLRNVRWYSYYCQQHRIPAPTYHQHHINLWRQLHWQTGSPVFANQMDQLLDDFPSPFLRTGSAIALASGTHTLYKFDTKPDGSWDKTKNDAQLATKKISFSRATQAPVGMRRRIYGRGVYYRISAGAYAGWWIGEAWPNAFLRGEYLTTVYRPQRTLTFPAGKTIKAYRFGTDGTAGSIKTLQFANDSNAPFDRRAVVNGRPMCRIAAGTLTGYWVWSGDVRTDGR
ncbi:D-glucuronyl C5-epimerase family protein [Streptomyces coeruleoprunus]|uniref:D-glucuronyl C5-epimerase family protein n=1 Tax=Streptomyces coeruleoprunus TaxID=285563 RepID=A0ABV9X8A0_9ACTN